MANTDLPNGFTPQDSSDKSMVVKWAMGASETTSIGDVVFLGADGYATLTAGTVLGVQVSSIIDGVTGVNNTTSSATEAEDYILVNIDPNLVMIAQISTGAATDPYTTLSSADCFDIVTTTGAQYINAAASSQDLFKVIRPASEPDGSLSAYGAYQKVYCKFNGLKHFLGTTA